jgi:drug/metabolite transporter (DMT)-like permease
VVSVSVAHLVLSEPLDLLFGMGALLVMVGVALTERG